MYRIDRLYGDMKMRMKIIIFITKVKNMLLENIIKDEDVEQDLQRNFSIHYSYSKNIIRKFI